MDFGQTVLNPIALLFTIIMCLMLLFNKREYVIIPVILVACFITQMQRIVIFGIDFPMIRVIIMFGFLRMLLRQERRTMTFNRIDKIMICYMVYKTIAYFILWSSIEAMVYMLGQISEVLGIYFLVRLVINDLEDYDVIIKTIIMTSIPIAIFMIIEQLTGGRNYFSIFGGVLEWNLIRGGKLRAQGAFSHPILAGTFGALLLPLAWGIWHRGKKFLSLCGLISGFIITFASSSSGPVVTLVTGMFGVLFWKLNKHAKKARNLLFFSLLFLHLVMKAPVWHLISRIDLVGGSTGYHRYNLIDAAVRNFFSWCAFGIRDTGVWGLGLNDITNQYILEGSRGGVITLIFFIAIIISCFQFISLTINRLVDKLEQQKYIWSLGVVLFAHVISFISVSYFGQMVIFYFMLIAMVSSLNNLPSIVVDNKT